MSEELGVSFTETVKVSWTASATSTGVAFPPSASRGRTRVRMVRRSFSHSEETDRRHVAVSRGSNIAERKTSKSTTQEPVLVHDTAEFPRFK